MSLEAAFLKNLDTDKIGQGRLPPVERWNPPYCGEIDMRIRRDGVWLYQGSPIGKARLVRLFSTVLKREGDDYFLVTPVEKMKITVEDAPFIAVGMAAKGEGRAQSLTFTTNVGDAATAGPDHGLRMEFAPQSEEPAPYIHIRRGLEARIARAVYYDLVALGTREIHDDQEMFGVWSGGVFFPFAPAADLAD
ncbi:MAG: DUF1285 domain-containing protein [Parvularculaceae bacterium]